MQLESALWVPVTMVIPSTFAASPKFSRASRRHGWESTSESLPFSCALPAVREEWDAQDVPKTILKSRAHSALFRHCVSGISGSWPTVCLACIHVCWAVHPDCKGGPLYTEWNEEYCLFPWDYHIEHGGGDVILGSKLWKNKELTGNKSMNKQPHTPFSFCPYSFLLCL